MSNHLDALRNRMGSEASARDHLRLRWLCHESFVANDHVDAGQWERLLERLARRDASAKNSSLVDAWFRVADVLTATLPDPDEDYLLGIAIAAYAQSCGIEYPDVETYVRLLEQYRVLYVERGRDAKEEDAGGAETDPFYEFVTCRLMDIETTFEAVAEYLEEPVQTELLGDPDVVVAGARLLWSVVDTRASEYEERHGKELPEESVEQCVNDGYWYLLACHHAKRAGIDEETLDAFVYAYQDGWFELMEELIRREVFRTDVLRAFCETNATIGKVGERGAELASDYFASPPENVPFLEYLNASLTAVAQDA